MNPWIDRLLTLAASLGLAVFADWLASRRDRRRQAADLARVDAQVAALAARLDGLGRDAERRQALRAAAGPLIALLADTMAILERLGPGARPGGVLRPKDKDIAAGLATLGPWLAPDDLERLRALAQACQGDEACKDREAALARLRELRDSIHRLAS